MNATTNATARCKLADLPGDRAFYWMSLPAKTRKLIEKSFCDWDAFIDQCEVRG